MKFLSSSALVALTLATVSNACSPAPGWRRPSAQELMNRANFVATATALEDSGVVVPNPYLPSAFLRTDVKMKLDCVIKTDGKTNADDLLNGDKLVGEFQGSGVCGVSAKKGERYLIFFDKDTKDGRVYLRLQQNGGPHTQTGAVPSDSEIVKAVTDGNDRNRWVLKGDKCPKLPDPNPCVDFYGRRICNDGPAIGSFGGSMNAEMDKIWNWLKQIK